MERREFTRVPLPFPVRLRHDGGVLHFERGLNVSASGIGLPSDQTLEVGTRCRIEIELEAQMIIEAEGVVVRHQPNGFSVKFEEIELLGFELLRTLVMFNAPDSEKVRTEFDGHLGLKSR